MSDRSSLNAGHRVDRNRRSAKQTIEDMANEFLRRPQCQENDIKLDVLEVLASRMSWTDLFNKIKFRKRESIQKAHWYQD